MVLSNMELIKRYIKQIALFTFGWCAICSLLAIEINVSYVYHWRFEEINVVGKQRICAKIRFCKIGAQPEWHMYDSALLRAGDNLEAYV